MSASDALGLDLIPILDRDVPDDDDDAGPPTPPAAAAAAFFAACTPTPTFASAVPSGEGDTCRSFAATAAVAGVVVVFSGTSEEGVGEG